MGLTSRHFTEKMLRSTQPRLDTRVGPPITRKLPSNGLIFPTAPKKMTKTATMFAKRIESERGPGGIHIVSELSHFYNKDKVSQEEMLYLLSRAWAYMIAGDKNLDALHVSVVSAYNGLKNYFGYKDFTRLWSNLSQNLPDTPEAELIMKIMAKWAKSAYDKSLSEAKQLDLPKGKQAAPLTRGKVFVAGPHDLVGNPNLSAPQQVGDLQVGALRQHATQQPQTQVVQALQATRTNLISAPIAPTTSSFMRDLQQRKDADMRRTLQESQGSDSLFSLGEFSRSLEDSASGIGPSAMEVDSHLSHSTAQTNDMAAYLSSLFG